MSSDQLTDLIAKIKNDQNLVEKLKTAVDLDAALLITKEAGFNITKTDWIRYQANRTLELSDEELENVSGGHRSGAGCGTDGDMCLY